MRPDDPDRDLIRSSRVAIAATILVIVVLLAMAIWFFFFAGSPLAPYN